jgi:hypothetical protein
VTFIVIIFYAALGTVRIPIGQLLRSRAAAGAGKSLAAILIIDLRTAVRTVRIAYQ